MLAALNWLMGMFFCLILKRIAARKFSLANWLTKLTTLQSPEVTVRLQPQSTGDCMENA